MSALTSRQREYWLLAEQGLSTKSIAERLGVSRQTALQNVKGVKARLAETLSADTVSALSERSKNALLNAGFALSDTAADIAPKIDEMLKSGELIKVKNLGRKSLREVLSWLESHNALKTSPSPQANTS